MKSVASQVYKRRLFKIDKLVPSSTRAVRNRCEVLLTVVATTRVWEVRLVIIIVSSTADQSDATHAALIQIRAVKWLLTG